MNIAKQLLRKGEKLPSFCKKIVRMIWEYEDRIDVVEGEEAQKLLETLDNMAMLLNIRGQNPFNNYTPKWTSTKKLDEWEKECLIKETLGISHE